LWLVSPKASLLLQVFLLKLCNRLVAAGVVGDLAKRAACTLQSLTAMGQAGIQATFDACRVMALLSKIQNFRTIIFTGFKSIDDSFKHLDRNSSNAVSLEEFTSGVGEGGVLVWPDASKDKYIAESLFDMLDQDKSGVVGVKEWRWLGEFSASRTFQELATVARLAERHCSAVPKAFHPAMLSALEKKYDAKVPFRDFNEMWKVIGKTCHVSARTCFCLLDANVSGNLCEREWLAFKALSQIKVTQDAAALGEKLCAHFEGGLEEAFKFICAADEFKMPTLESELGVGSE